jgi:hypothetical protein
MEVKENQSDILLFSLRPFFRASHCAYSHAPLIDVNWLPEMSISDSLVNTPNLNICFAFRCRTHNFTNPIQEVTKSDGKQLTSVRLHYHNTRMAGRRHWACKHGQCASITDCRLIGERRSFGYWDILKASENRLRRLWWSDCKLCKSGTVLYVIVIATCRRLINPITNPNPVAVTNTRHILVSEVGVSMDRIIDNRYID